MTDLWIQIATVAFAAGTFISQTRRAVGELKTMVRNEQVRLTRMEAKLDRMDERLDNLPCRNCKEAP